MGKCKESSAELGKIVEEKKIEGGKEKSGKKINSQVLMSCVGEKEQISKREKEEDHTVVKGRVEYQQKSSKKVNKQHFICINFYISSFIVED